MNYLTALLAFSATMIVLSTLATVIVEGFHKLVRTRARDFEEMLTKLYEDSVKPRLVQAGVNSMSSATDFAAQIMMNPAYHKTKSGLFRKIPWVKNFFSTSFEELTTRQFVEQFAQTDVGKLLQNKEQDVVKNTVAKLSYEFERYGDAATNYFERRASAISVFVAFALAITLNVDAIKLYNTLAKDKTLTEQVITNLDIAKLERAYLEEIQKADHEKKDASIIKEHEKVLESIRSESAKLEGLGIAIGHDYFPFCGAVIANTKGVEFKDSRCKKEKLNETKFLAPIRRVFMTQDGFGWLFSVLLWSNWPGGTFLV